MKVDLLQNRLVLMQCKALLALEIKHYSKKQYARLNQPSLLKHAKLPLKPGLRPNIVYIS